MNLFTHSYSAFDTNFMTVSVAVFYRCWWHPLWFYCSDDCSSHNVLPIVMGARPEEYALVAPYRSYIHVEEFESPKELAAYLNSLDTEDDLYNSYFRWKGTGEMISHRFLCRLCAMLQDDVANRFYTDFNDWWRGPSVCTGGSWRDVKKILKRVPGV
jgi:hypothetical protein